MLEQIRFVLVSTSHPGNIGATARALKTMGMRDLCLVAPERFPHQKANEMAANAVDILEQARVVETLDEALADCSLVIGTSARLRTIPWPLLNPREMAEKVKQEPANAQIAILFGREQSGLTNEELQRCHFHVHIPANADYSSLNIAAAVQILAYELRFANLHSSQKREYPEIATAAAQPRDDVSQDWDYRHATADEMEKFFTHLQDVLIELDFLKLNAPRRLMTRLRRLFFRTRPDIMEMNILRGILTAVQEHSRRPCASDTNCRPRESLSPNDLIGDGDPV